MQVLVSIQSTAQVHPEKLTKAMMAAAESRGALVKMGSVQSIVTDGSPTGAHMTSSDFDCYIHSQMNVSPYAIASSWLSAC